ncbi:MAG: hypothetical protein KGL39_36490 [Patescibacteria group bacterium]|nr:hypothetical protein [Patescibacteria group bacterium]
MRKLIIGALFAVLSIPAFAQSSNPGIFFQGTPTAGNCVQAVSRFAVADAGAPCGTGGGTPGGANTQLQYNNGGAFGGITGATTNGTAVTLVAPVLGTPASATLTNATGLPISTGVSGLGTGIATALGVNVGSAGAPVLFNGALGTPSSGTLTNATGLPISTGVSGLGTGIATALGVNVGSAGAPVLFNGALGTPSSGTLTNATGLPISTGVSGLGTGVATALSQTWVAPRILLTGNLTLYVRSDGSDSNNCLTNSAGGACATFQHAYNIIQSTYDLGGHTATIQAGTVTSWTAGLSINNAWVGGSIILDGAGGTITTTSSDTIVATLINAPGTFTVQNVKLVTSVAGGVCLHANVSKITFVVGPGVNFGACTNAQVGAGYGGVVEITNAYTISGGGSSHLLADSGGIIVDAGVAVTITGTPAFSSSFATVLSSGLITSFGNTWTGSATGVRYNATLNGVINTSGSGATYFPGNSAGTTATGGQYG